MFITRTEKKIATFNLNNTQEVTQFEELLNDPSINILSRKYEKLTETTYEGDMSTSVEVPYVRLEYEVCSL